MHLLHPLCANLDACTEVTLQNKRTQVVRCCASHCAIDCVCLCSCARLLFLTVCQRLGVHRLPCGVKAKVWRVRKSQQTKVSRVGQGWGQSRATLRGFWMVMSLFSTVKYVYFERYSFILSQQSYCKMYKCYQRWENLTRQPTKWSDVTCFFFIAQKIGNNQKQSPYRKKNLVYISTCVFIRAVNCNRHGGIMELTAFACTGRPPHSSSGRTFAYVSPFL